MKAEDKLVPRETAHSSPPHCPWNGSDQKHSCKWAGWEEWQLPWGSWCIGVKRGPVARQGVGKRLEQAWLHVCEGGWTRKEVEQLGRSGPKLGWPQIYSAWRGAHEPLAGGAGDGSRRTTLHQHTGRTGLGGELAHKLAAWQWLWCAARLGRQRCPSSLCGSDVSCNLGRRLEGLTFTWGLISVICRHLRR